MLQIRFMDEHSPDFPALRRLYDTAFPAKERRLLEELFPHAVPQLDWAGFYRHDTFCGFAMLLSVLDITHILYFAIEAPLRGQGIGGEALELLKKQYPDRRIIADLEREIPQADNNAERRRRKAFYERHGYLAMPVRYRWRDEAYEIVCSGGPLTMAEWENFWHIIEELEPLWKT